MEEALIRHVWLYGGMVSFTDDTWSNSLCDETRVGTAHLGEEELCLALDAGVSVREWSRVLCRALSGDKDEAKGLVVGCKVGEGFGTSQRVFFCDLDVFAVQLLARTIEDNQKEDLLLGDLGLADSKSPHSTISTLQLAQYIAPVV